MSQLIFYVYRLGMAFRNRIFPLPELSSTAPDGVIVPHPVVNSLSKAVDYPDCGVFVFWGMYQSGKTEALKELQRKLSAQKRQTIALDGAKFRGNLDHWFCKSLTCMECGDCLILDELLAPPLPSPFNGFTVASTTIIIDHFDAIIQTEDIQKVKNFVVGYAQQSNSGKRFNMLLCVSSVAYALEILSWNGGRKIMLAASPDAARWTEASLRPLVNKLVVTDSKEAILQCASIAGSPSCVRSMLYSGPNVRLAREWSKQWDEQCSCLRGSFKDVFTPRF
jgi:hypothetical protein